MSIAHVLAFLAALECVLACILSLAFCVRWPFYKPPYADRARRKSLAEGWRFILLLKLGACVSLGVAYVNIQFRFHNFMDQEEVWSVLTAMSCGAFGAVEIVGSWKAWKAARTYGSGRKLGLWIVSLLLIMELLAIAAVYGFCQYRMGIAWGVSYLHEWFCLLPCDVTYLCPATWAVVLFCGLLTKVVTRNIDWWPLRTKSVPCAIWFFLCVFAGYAVLVQGYGVYLAAMLSPWNPLRCSESAYLTRTSALTDLVPYLHAQTLEPLSPETWNDVTYLHERPGDSTYMAQLRCAAHNDRSSSIALCRLWTLDPVSARLIAEEILNRQKYWSFTDDAAVLFLEDPNKDVFKEFIPSNLFRRELSNVLFRWSVRAIPRGAKSRHRLSDMVQHRLSVGYGYMRSALCAGSEDKHWFRFNGEDMPEFLIPSAIDFMVFTRDLDAYYLMACPKREYALMAMSALIESSRRQNWSRQWCRFRMDYFLDNVHPDVAVACIKAAVDEYGEKAILNIWRTELYQDKHRYIEIGEQILDRWNEVVPGAPTLKGARGKKAINSFLTARLAQL